MCAPIYAGRLGICRKPVASTFHDAPRAMLATSRGRIVVMNKKRSGALPLPSLLTHECMRLRRIRRVHKRHEHSAELLEIDGLGEVTVEAGVDALLVDVAEDVCREGDDGLVGLLGAFFPPAQLLAGLVAVFVGHVEIALKGNVLARDRLENLGQSVRLTRMREK